MDGAQETLQSYELFQPSEYGKSYSFRASLVLQSGSSQDGCNVLVLIFVSV